MKWNKDEWSALPINIKIRILFAGILCVTILFSFLFIHFLYRNIYVKEIENSLLSEGKSLADLYTSGEISEDFNAQINLYNSISESEVLLTDNPRELSACLPFEINHQALITEEERRQLLKGDYLIKTGFEQRFERQIMGVVVPLLDENRLAGIIYLYLPLSPIEEVFNQSTPFLILGGVLFFFVTFIVINRMSRSFLTPIQTMELYAKELAKGNFSNRIPVHANDEIGKLTQTFNDMAEALDHSDKIKQDFLADVAHELRTPLSYVKGYSEVLQEGFYETKDEAQKYLSLIQRESERMQHLVNDLLDLAQLEGESFVLTKDPLVFSQLITDTVERFVHRIQEKQFTIEQELDEEIIIFGNHDRLQQIIYNLLENAIRYTNEKGMVFISLYKDKSHIFFVLADNGIGMSEKDVKRVGERFYRADKARNRKEGGTGLGLAIVKQLVHLHEGTMEINSKLEEGTTITLKFPYVSYDE